MNEWRCYLFGLAESNFSSEKSPAVSLIPSCRLLPVGLMDPRRDRKEACVCVCVCVCACGRVCSPCSFFHTCIAALSFSRDYLMDIKRFQPAPYEVCLMTGLQLCEDSAGNSLVNLSQ